MITYKTGNLLDDDAVILVNTVNTQGIMGNGIALQFKERYPNMYKEYKDACSLKVTPYKPGNVVIGYSDINKTYPYYQYDGHIIWNAVTKKLWQEPSKIEWIEQIIILIANSLHSVPNSIAIPPLGCGNGGLNWGDVKYMMELYFIACPNSDIRIYEPTNVKILRKYKDDIDTY